MLVFGALFLEITPWRAIIYRRSRFGRRSWSLGQLRGWGRDLHGWWWVFRPILRLVCGPAAFFYEQVTHSCNILI